jgi:hypothetical protein
VRAHNSSAVSPVIRLAIGFAIMILPVAGSAMMIALELRSNSSR